MVPRLLRIRGITRIQDVRRRKIRGALEQEMQHGVVPSCMRCKRDENKLTNVAQEKARVVKRLAISPDTRQNSSSQQLSNAL